MKKLALLPIAESCLVETGATLLAALLKKDLKVRMSCGGRGLCSTCHVWVTRGRDQVSPVGSREERTLRLVADRRPESRLACQCQVYGEGVEVEVPEAMYIEAADDLLSLLGVRAAMNILHPITGAVLIPKGKLVTRTLLEQSRGLEQEVRRLKQAAESGHGAGLHDSTQRRFAAGGASSISGTAIHTSRTVFDPRVVARPRGAAPLSSPAAGAPPRPVAGRQPDSAHTLDATARVLAADSSRGPSATTGVHHADDRSGRRGTAGLRAGATVGKYLLLECIGRGGGGMVFRALHTKLNTLVAIKFLRPDLLAGDPGAHARFTREAQLLAQLVHPHVVRVLDYDDDAARPHVVMEFVDGLSAADLIKQGGRVAPGRAVEIAVHILDGLEAARKLGMVHRDVKPGNVLLTRDGMSKLVDFGLAVVTRPDGGGTADPSVAGTAGYMSPEQATGSALDHRADQYSLGCTLFHLLTGQLPFNGGLVHQVIMQHMIQPAPFASDVCPAVPESLSRIVSKTLGKAPADRYPDYASLRADLVAFRAAELASGGAPATRMKA